MPEHSTLPPSEPGALRRPGLAIVLLATVAAVCAALGFWQLGRAGESRAVAERFEAVQEMPAATLRTTDGAREELRYRKVEIDGRYVPERQILIDNMVRDGIAGYYVLTPFAPDDGGRWLVVNRGWVRGDLDRRVLPEVSVGGSQRRIGGLLDRLPAPGLRLGREPVDASDAALRVMSFPSVEDLENSLARPLFGYQLLLDAEQRDGFARDFPAPGLEPERHLAYAAQWWLFGSIAAGAAGLIGWRVLRRRT